MVSFVGRRLLYSIPVILLATILVFVFVRETTDPTARLRSRGDKESVARERARLHLDDPLPVQYGKWLKDFATGDWGNSSVTNSSATEAFGRAFWNTFQLVAWGILVSALIAVAIGVYSALRQYSVLDYTFTGLSFIGLAMPPFSSASSPSSCSSPTRRTGWASTNRCCIRSGCTAPASRGSISITSNTWPYPC